MRWFFTLCCLLILTQFSLAAVIHVPGDQFTVQEGVEIASDGDTVLVADGIYNEHILINNRSLTILSENGYESTSIISDTSRCMTILNSDSIVLDGITFTGVVSSTGGSLYIDSSIVTMARCRVTGSAANGFNTMGGGIYGENVRLTLSGCTISNNRVTSMDLAYGGGIYLSQSTLYIDSSAVSGNSAMAGTYPPGTYYNAAGGIYCTGDNLTILNSTVNSNYCSGGDGNGGGMYYLGSDFVVENCNFNGNWISSNHKYAGGASGGGCFIIGNNGLIKDCQFNSNSVAVNSGSPSHYLGVSGGGFYISGSNNTIEGNQFCNNSISVHVYYGCDGDSHAKGGGACISGGNNVVGNLITNNTATASGYNECVQYRTFDSFGGGLSISGGTLENNTVAFNSTSASGSNIAPEGQFNIFAYGGGCYIENLISSSNNICAFNSTSDICDNTEEAFICNSNSLGSGYYAASGSVAFDCNLYFANIGSVEWYGDNASTNMNADPMFCDTALADFSLMDLSPAVPENNNCGTWIGAFEIGCSGRPFVGDKGIIDEATDHVIDNTPEFWWSYNCPLENPEDSFTIAVGTDTDWQYAEMWNPAPFPGPDTSITYGGAELIDGETYYLRLRVHNGLVWSDWYGISFRMNSVPSVPVLLSPGWGEVVESATPTLYVENCTDAEGDLLTYDYVVFDDSEYVYTRVYDVEGQIDSTGWRVDVPMIDNMPYMWTVRANDGYEQSEWSLVGWFWVNGIEGYPKAFNLIYPPDTGWSQVYMSPALFWWYESFDNDPLDSIYYRLLIAMDSNFTFVAAYDSLYQTCCALPEFATLIDLDYGTHYWWKVYAVDTKGNMTQSNGVADFMTWILGDANADFGVNVGDAVFLINYIFRNGEAPDPLKIGDVNGDCEVNVGDAVYLINYVFRNGDPPQVGCAGEPFLPPRMTGD